MKHVAICAVLALLVLLVPTTLAQSAPDTSDEYGHWMEAPPGDWPEITMVNRITYTDDHHPVAGCAFLIDTGDEILAATAKHVLYYFKSKEMRTVSFGGSLKRWAMFPKNHPDDVVIVGRLINEDVKEPLKPGPVERDWLLFEVEKRSPDIQPLRLRSTPLEPGEKVYVIGWRYPDEGPPMVLEGRFRRVDGRTLLVAVKDLAYNKIPGLSGSPVIDSHGYVIGLMSQGAGALSRLSPVDYPKSIIAARSESD